MTYNPVDGEYLLHAYEHASARWALQTAAGPGSSQHLSLVDHHVRVDMLERRGVARALACGVWLWCEHAAADQLHGAQLRWAQSFVAYRALARGLFGWAFSHAHRRQTSQLMVAAAQQGFAHRQMACWRALCQWRGVSTCGGRRRIERARRARDTSAATLLLKSLDHGVAAFCNAAMRDRE